MAKKQPINVHEAKTHFSRLLDQVSRGSEITIAKAGTPVAKLVPIGSGRQRALGFDAGLVDVSEDFDAPLPEHVLTDFER